MPRATLRRPSPCSGCCLLVLAMTLGHLSRSQEARGSQLPEMDGEVLCQRAGCVSCDLCFRSVRPLIALLFHSAGRDKFNKTIQYASRYLWWHYCNAGLSSQCPLLTPFPRVSPNTHLRACNADPKNEQGLKYKGLFVLFRDARKLDRILKVSQSALG